MQLPSKTAVIYGAGGAVGRTIAQAFAREGATVFLAGRHRKPLDDLATSIARAGGTADVAEVDALDEAAIEKHLDSIVARQGRLDISFNAIGIPQPGIQGTALLQLPIDRYMEPISIYTRAHFATARAAARRMVERHAGVLLMHTPEPARNGVPLVGGMGPAWAALEAMTRFFSAELAATGVRAVCLRTTGLPETATIDTVFGLHATAAGVERAQFLAMVESRTHRQRSTALSELANAAVFLASDRASALTGTTVNLTGGISVD